MSEYIITVRDDADPDGWHRLTKPAEPLVRCRDCRWCMAYHTATYCDRFAHELPTVDPDGFCAWAEPRREGEGE